MKINIWLLTGTLIVPFFLFSQDVQPTSINANSNRENLIALSEDSLAKESPFPPVEQMPELLERAYPKYPESALKDSIEGRVVVEVLINEQGYVEKTKILKGIREDLNNAAIEAVKKSKFIPGRTFDKAVKAKIVIPFLFKLAPHESGRFNIKDNASQKKLSVLTTETIENILKGKNIEIAKKKEIEPEAYLIYGKEYLNLYAVLNGEHKNIKLTEGPESKILFSSITILDDKTTAYMILKTQIKKDGPIRFHTIIFAKTENSDWQIKHWHVSW